MKKGTLTAIIVILLAAIIVLVCGIGSSWFTNGDFSTWFNSWGKGTEQEQPADEEQGEETGEEQEQGGMLVEEGDSNGISLMSVKIAAADYDEYGVSPMAETAYTVTATVSGTEGADTSLDWSVVFVAPEDSWATGKTVTDYVTVTPTADGALTANVECLQAFGARIKVVAASRLSPSVKGEVFVDYARRVSDVSYQLAESLSGQTGFTSEIELFHYIQPTVAADSSEQRFTYEFEKGVGTVDDSFDVSMELRFTTAFVEYGKTAISGFYPNSAFFVSVGEYFDTGKDFLVSAFGETWVNNADNFSLLIDALDSVQSSAPMVYSDGVFHLLIRFEGEYSTHVEDIPILVDTDFMSFVSSVDLDKDSIVF